MTNNIELLNGWKISNYTLKYEEISQPGIPVIVTGTIIVESNRQSVLIGPIDPWRECKVDLAGNIESRPGAFASFCVRTDEDGNKSTLFAVLFKIARCITIGNPLTMRETVVL